MRIDRLGRPWRARAALATLALFAVSSAFTAVAVGQTISLRQGSEPGHLDAGQMIIVGGVKYVGRDSGRCKLWISTAGEFRSAGCDVIPDERPWKERLADVWEDKPAAVIASAAVALVILAGAVILVARIRRRRSLRAGDASGSIPGRSAP